MRFIPVLLFMFTFMCAGITMHTPKHIMLRDVTALIVNKIQHTTCFLRCSYYLLIYIFMFPQDVFFLLVNFIFIWGAL